MNDQPTARRYDTSAMDDLMERTQYYIDRAEPELIEADYLLAALAHYRRAYSDALAEVLELREFAAAMRQAAHSIVSAIDNLPAA